MLVFLKYLVRFRTNDNTFPSSVCGFSRAWRGPSLPSTSSIAYLMPDWEHHMLWYFFRHGHGFLGTTINTGHIHFLTHLDILSSIHEIQDARNLLSIVFFHDAIISLASCILYLYAGGSEYVYFRWKSISSKWCFDVTLFDLKVGYRLYGLNLSDQNSWQWNPI